MERLKHVVPTIEYKEAAIDYIKELKYYNLEIHGAGGLSRYLDNYEEWLLKLVDEKNIIADENLVPAETYFLVREDDNKIIGMINIRLALNLKLQEFGGHIGYGIRPTERRKGYNKVNLYLALKRCQELGIASVYLDCDIDNPGSYKTMEALGGIRIKEYESKYHEGKIYRYVIDVNEAIKNHKETYELKIEKLK